MTTFSMYTFCASGGSHISVSPLIKLFDAESFYFLLDFIIFWEYGMIGER